MSIQNIEHFVVLMLENRSFDHVFGFHPKVGKDGLSGTESNLLNPHKPASRDNPKLFVTKKAPWRTSGEGPSHSLSGTNLQLAGNKSGPPPGTASLNGFVADYQSALVHARTNQVRVPNVDQLGEVMASFPPEALPSINALADNFCLCTHWHSEVPGPTQPNRLFMHAATSLGLVYNVWSRKFDCRTIYQNLQENEKTWATYQVGKSVKFNEVREFSNINRQHQNFRTFESDFDADMQGGKFPNYSFIVPRYVSDAEGPANSQHAPDDVRHGDNLIADVYAALRRNVEVWNRSVLIVLYDEHGGFYDHVAPPAAVAPDEHTAPLAGDPDYVPHFTFNRLGLRVPAILASPWIKAGTICTTPLQHTSVLATVKNRFGLPKFLTQRDQKAKTFESVFTESAARTDTPMTLPRASVDAFDASDARHPLNRPLDESRLEMVQGVARAAGASWHANEPTTHGEAARQTAEAIAMQFPNP